MKSRRNLGVVGGRSWNEKVMTAAVAVTVVVVVVPVVVVEAAAAVSVTVAVAMSREIVAARYAASIALVTGVPLAPAVQIRVDCSDLALGRFFDKCLVCKCISYESSMTTLSERVSALENTLTPCSATNERGLHSGSTPSISLLKSIQVLTDKFQEFQDKYSLEFFEKCTKDDLFSCRCC